MVLDALVLEDHDAQCYGPKHQDLGEKSVDSKNIEFNTWREQNQSFNKALEYECQSEA